MFSFCPSGFLNEINMLKKLQGEDRIVKLFAFEEVEKVKFLVLKGTMSSD
jgi:hypothetical protein